MRSESSEPVPLRRLGPCPICKKPANRATFPFCSDRCRDVDLNRWLEGSYRIPGRPDEDEDSLEANDDRD